MGFGGTSTFGGIYDLFAQAALTPDLNAQAEFRRRQSKAGDLSLNFDPGQLRRDQESKSDQETARVGLRFSPSPVSDVIASVIHSQRNFQLRDRLSAMSKLDIDSHADGFQSKVSVLISDRPFQFYDRFLHLQCRPNWTINYFWSPSPFLYPGSPSIAELGKTASIHIQILSFLTT